MNRIELTKSFFYFFKVCCIFNVMNPAEIYILEQREPFKGILLHLQVIIENTIPELVLKYKYKIPFYYLNDKPFCYLNVPKNKSYVDVGFWSSVHLSVHLDEMVTEGRKMMRSLRYGTVEDIDQEILVAVLKDAESVADKGFWK
ncbi:DUF1801 domain-containing protein [Sungkyunkwania multivorans]|uniref:DUF1801 domain-containing protein n=1 Tax=Sungkyunkwania multivorans TaxID=1173618 RepID=A0ABW3CTW0_9FLAO